MSREILTTYHSRLDELTERAKRTDPGLKGLPLGERHFVELLHFYIGQYRVRALSAEELQRKKKELEALMIDYWDMARIFREDTQIRNSMGQTLTEAVKSGCPVCKKLVAIFDGREGSN